MGVLAQVWLLGLLNPLCCIWKCLCPEVKHLVRTALRGVFTEEFTWDKNSCSCQRLHPAAFKSLLKKNWRGPQIVTRSLKQDKIGPSRAKYSLIDACPSAGICCDCPPQRGEDI